MRKFLLMGFAALGLALAVPLAASAAPVMQGEALGIAADSVTPVLDTAWHCRRWSGWCRGRPAVRRYYRWRRWR